MQNKNKNTNIKGARNFASAFCIDSVPPGATSLVGPQGFLLTQMAHSQAEGPEQTGTRSKGLELNPAKLMTVLTGCCALHPMCNSCLIRAKGTNLSLEAQLHSQRPQTKPTRCATLSFFPCLLGEN